MSTDTTDALTRLARYARDLAEDDCETILALISEAREEMGALRTRAEKAEHSVRLVTQIRENAARGKP